MNKTTKSLLRLKKEQNRERARANQKNATNEAEADGHTNSENIVSPVVEMEENRIMPLFIFIGNLKAPKIGNTKMNYMCTASHLKKTNEIEVRGRMRYEATQRKTVFAFKEKFKLNELNLAKEKIRKAYEAMRTGMWLIETTPTYELNFEVNESLDSIIKKINDSDQFNVTQLDKK